jgi:hypothetical protein
MSAAARRRRREGDEPLDVELFDLPLAARWREWMLRVEAAIFASEKPVSREALVRLVGEACRFDDLIADLIHELRGRPYDLTLVAGGYALRTKTRFAPAIRAAHPGRAGDAVGELSLSFSRMNIPTSLAAFVRSLTLSVGLCMSMLSRTLLRRGPG